MSIEKGSSVKEKEAPDVNERPLPNSVMFGSMLMLFAELAESLMVSTLLALARQRKSVR
jgi:hypothetical protein